jgi:nucleotide-binding universal stress UspA family protein
MSAVQPASPIVVPKIEIKHILVPTDFSDYSRSALKQAVAIARLHGSDLVVLHVIPPEPPMNYTLEPEPWRYGPETRFGQTEMTAAEREIASDVQYDFRAETGSIQSVLSRIINEREISLIILGTHGRTGIRKLILGSVAEQVFRFADCPVMTIGPEVEPKLLRHGCFESILLATDFSAGSKHALPYALGFAEESHARLTLVHVLDEGSVAAIYLHQQLAKTARAQLQAMLPVKINLKQPPDVEVVSGYPVEEILRIARKNQADLIVLGVHKASRLGAHTSAHLPWTIAHTVVCHAKCPVLTVRG